jgi:SAM-dependent methyltransferase
MTYEEGQALTSRWLGAAGLAAGQRVLDLGCGPGNLARLALDHIGPGGQLVGLDRDEAFLAAARAQHAGRDARFAAADLRGPLPEDLGAFDAVLLRRVLMYLPDPAGLLRRAAVHLRPGGLIFVQELIMDEPPASLPLHRACFGWLRRMLDREGASASFGRGLPALFRAAGLPAPVVRAEADVAAPGQPCTLAHRLRFVLPRLAEAGVDLAEVQIDTLEARLRAERDATGEAWWGDLAVAAWARLP